VRRAGLGLPARVVALAMLLAATAIFTAGRADASALRPAATGSPQSSGGTWGNAKEVPGIGALNKGGRAGIISVSCATAGNCSAGGYYSDASGDFQVFVVGETGGTWGTAIEVPGTAALNKGANAAGITDINSVSCATAGNCSAGGQYIDASGDVQAFVVGETGGTWGTAIEVPGTAALNEGGDAQISSVSCATAGNCSAGGQYTDASGHVQAFVVRETGGTWGKAIEVPGTAALNEGGDAQISSVSCATAGDCGAGGQYTDASGDIQAFVVGETGGTWGTAIEVPGTAALNEGGDALISSVSCATAGNCSAGGQYTDASGDWQALVVSEEGGIWGTAEEAPGTATLNPPGHYAAINSVSCATAGNCSAGGYADGVNGDLSTAAFVIGQAGGTWGTAEFVAGSIFSEATSSVIDSVSCATPGHCSAGGQYLNADGHFEAFVVGET
jgi:hypothetical protein